MSLSLQTQSVLIQSALNGVYFSNASGFGLGDFLVEVAAGGGGGGGGGVWGMITGTLSAQTDLQAVLNALSASIAAAAPVNNANFTGSTNINSLTLPPATQLVATGGSVNSATSYNILTTADSTPVILGAGRFGSPLVAGTFDGQVLYLLNNGPGTVTMHSGHGVVLPGQIDYTMAVGSTIEIIWSVANSSWMTVATGNNGTNTDFNGIRINTISAYTGFSSISLLGNIITDSSNVTAIYWNNRLLLDAAGLTSLDWTQRLLEDSSGITSIDWQNRLLENTFGGSADWVKGFRALPGTTAQKNSYAISAGLGATDYGIQWYDTDLSEPFWWNGTAWTTAISPPAPQVLALTSNPSVGGAVSEAMTVTGLLTTDTILAVTQKTQGAATRTSLAFIGWNTVVTGGLTAEWVADPGPGAVLVVAISR
jgi:hypothetical protein